MELKNIHEACFVVDNPYWQGIVVTFFGLSAKFFYMLLKEKKLRGEVFSDGILGRKNGLRRGFYVRRMKLDQNFKE
jgi:hypothetical protein